MARYLPRGGVNPPAPPRPSLLARSRALRLALGALAALVVLACTFDWNWFAPLVRHYVESRSGRSMTFDRMSVRFEHGLDPTIEFRNLRIQNAPWAASTAPFIQAARISANVSWRSIGSSLIIVNRIDVEDGQIDMERRADGVRNWRLTHPDDRGPPHASVLSVDARRSQLHLIHRGIGLEMTASTTPLAAVDTLAGHPELPLTKRLQFKGTHKGNAFDGDTAVSDVLTFGVTPQRFALKGTARMGALKLDAAGLSNDVHALGDVDLDATLSADGPGWPLPDALARVRPLVARGHVAKAGDHWTGQDVHLRAGRETSGVIDADFIGNPKSETPRRMLKATLRDAVLDADDLSRLRGKTPPGEATRAGTRADADHALSTQALPLERLRELDADIDLRPARFVGAERGIAQSLRAHATLANGVLDVRSIDAGLADGHVTGTLRVDASRTPAEVALAVSARGLRVDRMSATLAANGTLAGAVDGHADVKTRGDSSRALAANASGTITASLAPGASVARRLDANLGLNGGEWLRTLFDKSARVPVQCADVTLALASGVATPRRFVFETPDTALAATGSLDLAKETLALTLTPTHKKLALLSLDKSIHAQGSWHDVKISLERASGDTPLRCGS